MNGYRARCESVASGPELHKVFPFRSGVEQAFAGVGDVGDSVLQRGQVAQIVILDAVLRPVARRAALQIGDRRQIRLQCRKACPGRPVLNLILDGRGGYARNLLRESQYRQRGSAGLASAML